MISFVMSEDHQYTLRAALESGALDLPLILLSYEDFLAFPKLPLSDYVFVDLERLDDARMAAAAARLAALRRVAPGLRVLNAPEPRLGRLAVMEALHRSGINRFRVTPASDIPDDLAYPVFLRRLDNHDGPMTGLLGDRSALQAALAGFVAQGLPLAAIAITEYVDARNAEGLHQKASYFRIGDTLFPSALDFSTSWVCKGMTQDPHSVHDAGAELAFLSGNSHDALLLPAFEAAGIGYGRADYVVVDGRAQIFEINTNPFLDPPEILPESMHRYAALLLARWREAVFAFSPATDGAPRWVAVEGAAPQPAVGHRLRRAFRGGLAATGQLHREVALMRPVRTAMRPLKRTRDWIFPSREAAPETGR